jgi:hypothetical protein
MRGKNGLISVIRGKFAWALKDKLKNARMKSLLSLNIFFSLALIKNLYIRIARAFMASGDLNANLLFTDNILFKLIAASLY